MFQFFYYFRKYILIGTLLLSLNISYAQQKLSFYDSLGVMPAFRFYQLNGQIFTPDSLSKEKQIVLIYFIQDCPYCEEQAEIVLKHLNDFTDVEFIFISREDTAVIRNYAVIHMLAGKKQIRFVQDKERLYYKYYNASYTPSIHIYDKKLNLLLFNDGVLDDKQMLKYIK